jgi:membrane protein YqaA with SNARE-associated domain
LYTPEYFGVRRALLTCAQIPSLQLTRSVAVSVSRASASHRFWHWIAHLGGPGLIVLGIIDSSVIPVPGSMDAFTIILAAGDRTWWPYYAAMAVLGSVLGGYITYQIARREGQERLAHRLPQAKLEKVTTTFNKWGFWAIAVPAVLPPPMPMVPFLLVAGAMQYSSKKFVAALALGRTVRFGVLAFLAAIYGGSISNWFLEYGYPILYVFIAASVATTVALLVRWRIRKAHAH